MATIIQIIPAQPGWHVVYPAGARGPGPGSEESRGVEFVPVACWALVEDAQGGRKVVPMAGSTGAGELVCEDADAVGVSPPGRRPSDWAPRVRGKKPSALLKQKKEGPPTEAAAPAPRPQPAAAPKPADAPKPEPKPKPQPMAESVPAPSDMSVMIQATASEPPTTTGHPTSEIPGGDVFDSEDEY